MSRNLLARSSGRILRKNSSRISEKKNHQNLKGNIFVVFWRFLFFQNIVFFYLNFQHFTLKVYLCCFIELTIFFSAIYSFLLLPNFWIHLLSVDYLENCFKFCFNNSLKNSSRFEVPTAAYSNPERHRASKWSDQTNAVGVNDVKKKIFTKQYFSLSMN